ncbi:MAG TPA: hypothetical protein VJX92_14080 [Methylomirabilota bacterium]|nr:hypothetical protein [Methylomirabilota bacterium]
MSPTPARPGPVRSAAVLNEAIRALWQRADGRLTTAQERDAYERLVVEWAAAVRAERDVPKAA